MESNQETKVADTQTVGWLAHSIIDQIITVGGVITAVQLSHMFDSDLKLYLKTMKLLVDGNILRSEGHSQRGQSLNHVYVLNPQLFGPGREFVKIECEEENRFHLTFK